MKKVFTRRAMAAVAVIGVSSLLLTTGPTSVATAAPKKVGVSLILKNLTNPFFIAMTAGAKAKAKSLGMNLSVAAGKDETDDAAQVAAIENAISKKDSGILITPISPGV